MSRHVRAWRLSTVFAAVIASFLSGHSAALANHNFTDVPNSAFYHDFVDFLVQNGITSGCGGGQFCGESAVTRGQIAVFLQKLAVALGNCPPDSVKVGTTCVDRYEASVWKTTNAAVIQKIRLGTVTEADLNAGAQRMSTGDDLVTHGCPRMGEGCVDAYAVSIPGVKPTTFITWFQAVATARNAGKRLPTNAEWQAAALGTPKASCNTSGPFLAATGSFTFADCISDAGARDMVGNVWEWVADWVPRSTACGSWFAGTINDTQCFAGAATDGEPGALVRGGAFDSGDGAGIFAVSGKEVPWSIRPIVGFRAAR